MASPLQRGSEPRVPRSGAWASGHEQQNTPQQSGSPCKTLRSPWLTTRRLPGPALAINTKSSEAVCGAPPLQVTFSTADVTGRRKRRGSRGNRPKPVPLRQVARSRDEGAGPPPPDVGSWTQPRGEASYGRTREARGAPGPGPRPRPDARPPPRCPAPARRSLRLPARSPVLVVLVEVLVRVVDLLMGHPAGRWAARSGSNGAEERAQRTERPRPAKATTRLRPTDRRPNDPGLNPTARR